MPKAKNEKLEKSRLIWMYTQMVRIREFEERVKRAFLEHPGVIRGHSHLGDGAEASIVGALSTRERNDLVMPSYRCHGYAIVLGSPDAEHHGGDFRAQRRSVQGLWRVHAPRRPGPSFSERERDHRSRHRSGHRALH